MELLREKRHPCIPIRIADSRDEDYLPVFGLSASRAVLASKVGLPLCSRRVGFTGYRQSALPDCTHRVHFFRCSPPLYSPLAA